MSADDQAFLDVLSSVPNDIKRYSSDVADYVDKHLNHVSNVLRETLAASPWIPESARPKPPPPPPRAFPSGLSSASTYERIHHWISNNKILTGAIVVAIGGVTYYIVTKQTRRKKRRAKRAGNGQRLEVVVIAGSPSEPITRSISLDLERRGFIVYIVCNTIEEEMQVHGESRPDIKPLMIDIVDPNSARESIERFTTFLQRPHAAFQGARLHHLTFRSLIFIPSTSYPSKPIATLSPSTLSDLLNTRLLTPVITLQSFLPLLQDLPLPHPHPHPHAGLPPPPTKPSILLLTPSIITSIKPAFHLPESMIVSALSAFSTVLSSELAPLNIPVTHLQLGTFDIRAFAPHNKQLQTLQASRAETIKWDDGTRSAYARNYNNANRIKSAIGQGSSLRVLNDAVFDAMVNTRGGAVSVGMGSSVYGFVGRWAPNGLVGWMMGVRNVNSPGGEFGRGGWFGKKSPGIEVTANSSGTSPGSASSEGASALEQSDYINVYDNGDGEESTEAWKRDEEA